MINLIKNVFGISPKVNFNELIQEGAVIIDVRTKDEFRDGHIKGAINIPLSSIGNQLAKLKKDKPIITCCASGMRSVSARSILKSNGFEKVYNGGGWMNLKNKI